MRSILTVLLLLPSLWCDEDEVVADYEPHLAGSLGLKRLAPDGVLQTVSVSAGYREYYSLQAEAGMQISVAAVPCSGRFDMWAREGFDAPIERAATDRYFSFESLMQTVIQKGRFFSLRLGTRDKASSFTIALSAAYGTTATLQLVLQSHTPRTTTLVLDRLHWPPTVQQANHNFWLERTTGPGMFWNAMRTTRRSIDVTVAPPNMAMVSWAASAADETVALYAVKSNELTADTIIETACGLEAAAVLPDVDPAAAVVLQDPNCPNPCYAGGLTFGNYYQFAVTVTGATDSRAAAWAPSPVRRMPAIPPNKTTIDGLIVTTMCKNASLPDEDPCAGQVDWMVRGGSNITLQREGVKALLARYASTDASVACTAAMTKWLCGETFPRSLPPAVLETPYSRIVSSCGWC